MHITRLKVTLYVYFILKQISIVGDISNPVYKPIKGTSIDVQTSKTQALCKHCELTNHFKYLNYSLLKLSHVRRDSSLRNAYALYRL